MVFPLVVRAQKNAAKMANHSPGMQVLQSKMTDARRRGDTYESQQLGGELKDYMSKHKINPLSNVVPILVQLPFFLSMFVGLRKMANLPVESMATGGLYWFQDLTIMDPYYVLPLMVSATFYLQLYLAADGMSLDALGPLAKKFMMGMPVFVLLFTYRFPAVSRSRDRETERIYLYSLLSFAGRPAVLALHQHHIRHAGQDSQNSRHKGEAGDRQDGQAREAGHAAVKGLHGDRARV